MVCKYVNVFPKNFLELPPSHELEFTTELMLGTHPILKEPYKMIPIELAELRR